MKKLLCILFLIPSALFSQNWQWANQVGSNILQSYDYARVITDGTNSYLVGRYSNSIYFQTDTLSSDGTNDLFIIKYGVNGNEIWAKGFGGNGTGTSDFESAFPVFDPSSNSIYISGKYAGVMILGSDTLSSFPDAMGLFICKMNLNGNFVWSKSINNVSYHASGFTGDAEVYCSHNGIIYLTGGIMDTITFCSNTILPGGFMLKFDSNGNCLSARNIYSGPTNRVRVNFIGNDIILSGSFKDAIFSIDTTNILNNGPGNYDFYISRADTNGNIKWTKHFGYAGSDVLGSVDVNNNSNEIYFCGSFQDSLAINGFTLFNTGKDILFSKLDEYGNTVWNRQCSAVSNVGGANYVKVDNEGNIYSVGFFSGTATFGTFTISTTNTYDMFLARYNSGGDCLGVRHFGYATGGKVVVDSSGNPICSGGFFNTITIGSNTFSSYGYIDVFLAKCDVFTGIEVEARKSNNHLLIYANPNQGKCNITVPDEFLNEKNLTLSIFSNEGKIIQQKTLEMNEGKISLNLEAEAKGIYTVTLSNGDKTYRGKIIFE